MEKSNYKKSLLLRLYLEAIIKTPIVYMKNKDSIQFHKNTLYTLNVLLFNKPYNSDLFACVNNLEEEDFVKANIETFKSYSKYNNHILATDTSELNFEEIVLTLRDFLDKQNKEPDITYEEMLEHTNDFFNSLPDKEIRDIFNKSYKERNKNIRIYDETSCSYLLPTIDYSLISLGTENLTYKNMLYDLVHEYGHLIETGVNSHLMFYSKDYEPAELMPVFFSLLSTFYFDESLSNNTEKYIALMQTAAFIDNIKYTEEIMNTGYQAFKEKYNDITIDIYEDYSLMQIYSYLIPMLTSYELLTKYKEDPEKTLYTLKKLVMNNMDYLDALNQNKIQIGENSTEAIKMLKK